MHVSRDCRASFQSTLMQQAAKLKRSARNRSRSSSLLLSETSTTGSIQPGTPRDVSPLFDVSTDAGLRPSFENRMFTEALSNCSSIDPMELESTSDAICSGQSVRTELGLELKEHTLMTDRIFRPVRVATLRTRRCALSIGPHYALSTAVRYSMCWLCSWKTSPFAHVNAVLRDVVKFESNLLSIRDEVSKQYIPANDLRLDLQLVIAAYRTCKQPIRDEITPADIEQAMSRIGLANPGEPRSTWFDLIRSFDFDNTGFMEFNEFFLLCNSLQLEQVKSLAIASIACHFRVMNPQAEPHWTPVCLDIDSSTGNLRVYFDSHTFARSPIDRMKLKATPAKSNVLEIYDVRAMHTHLENGRIVFTIIDQLKSTYELLMEDSDLSIFTRMLKGIIASTRYYAADTPTLNSEALFQITHSAAHSFLA